MQDSLAKKGLAIIVTCSGAGAKHLTKLSSPDIDATTMKNALDEIGFYTHLIKNETEPTVSLRLRDISSSLSKYKEEKGKVIIFVFSGHGVTGGRICFEDYDNSRNTGTINMRDIISYFVTDNTLETPKLFLIDACRGDTTLNEEAKSDQSCKWIGRKSNYRIDYATIDDHQAFGNGESGSRFISAVASKICDEKYQSSSFQDIMADVQKEVWESPSFNKQQTHTDDRLHCGRLHLCEMRL